MKMMNRCRGKFVALGKFFPPQYFHNVTKLNPNRNPNPSPNLNPDFNPTLNFDRSPNFYPIPNINLWGCLGGFDPRPTAKLNLELT